MNPGPALPVVVRFGKRAGSVGIGRAGEAVAQAVPGLAVKPLRKFFVAGG